MICRRTSRRTLRGRPSCGRPIGLTTRWSGSTCCSKRRPGLRKWPRSWWIRWRRGRGRSFPAGSSCESCSGRGRPRGCFASRKRASRSRSRCPSTTGVRNRLRSEAQLIERLRHEHIVTGYGMRKVGSRECLLLEFVGSENRDDPAEPGRAAAAGRHRGAGLRPSVWR